MTTTVIVRFIDRSLAHIGFNVVYYVKLSGWDKTLMVSLLELLRDGYFPRELPPPFTSQSFATTIVSSGSALPNSIMNGELRNNRRWAMAAPYHISRIGKLQRRLSIPNPITQARLSKEIADNWAVLQAFTSQSQLSLSTPKAGTNRAIIPENSWGVIPGIRAVKQIGERFLVKTDINNFYHSIYTHSLPWALHTKSVAKVNRGHNYLGNLLDSLIQMGQEGQTSGIPIGPDTSFMLAELLLTAIDAELIGKLGPLNGFRYVDDYELCFPTMSEAEKALHQLELILGEFELSLNPTKTGIHDTPFILQDNWATELNRFEIRDKPVSQRNDLIGYFSRVGELSKVFEDQSVYRFAIARFRTLKVDASNVNLLQNLLLHCISSEQGTAPFALEILVILNKSGYPPPQSQLKRVFDSQILYHGAQGHTSEVAWPYAFLGTPRLFAQTGAPASVNATRSPLPNQAKMRRPSVVIVGAA